MVDSASSYQTPVVDLGLYRSIVESGVFGRSKRQLELFAYLLTENIAGRGEHVTESQIAIDVLGRNADFDSSIDSIVRTEMYRLRKNLAIFSRTQHFGVSIPKASFVITLTNALPVAAINDEFGLANDGGRSRLLFCWMQLKRALFIAVIFALSMSSSEFVDEYVAPISRLEGSFRARVSIQFEIEDVKVLEDVKHQVFSDIAAYNAVNIAGAEDADYHLHIKGITSGDSADYSVELTSKGGRILMSKTIDVSDLGSVTSIDKLGWVLQFEFLLHQRSTLAVDYAFASWVDGRKQMIHRCLLDANSAVVGDELSYFAAAQLPACLDSSQTNYGPDKATLDLSLAELYLHQARGLYALDVAAPLALAVRLNENAEKLLGDNKQVLLNKISFFLVSGVSNVDAAHGLLSRALSTYPDDYFITQMASFTYGLYLGEWAQAAQLSESSLRMLRTEYKANVYSILPLAEALIEDDTDDIYFWSQRLFRKQMPGAVWALASACALQKSDMKALPFTVHSSANVIANFDVSTFAQFERVVKAYKYHETVETKILTSVKECRVFVE